MGARHNVGCHYFLHLRPTMERLPYFHLLHLFALFVLTAHTFMAFANPSLENKKRTAIIIVRRRFTGSGLAKAMNVWAVSTSSEKMCSSL